MSDKEKLLPLYIAANKMMHEIGAKGMLTTEHDCVADVMDALHDIDEGEDRSIEAARATLLAAGHAVVPVELIKRAGSDNMNRSLNWRKAVIDECRSMIEAAEVKG